MRPDPQRTAVGELLEPGQQRAAHPALPGRGRDDQLGLGVPGAVTELEPGVAGERAVRLGGDDVPAAGRAAVLQPQLGLLRQRADAVGRRGRAQQREDGGGPRGVEPGGVGDGDGAQSSGAVVGEVSATVPADRSASARAAAAVASATCWSSL
ncbi:hypothetical protein GCM10027261_13250 [Geodermatophilus arenarius]